MVITVDTMVDQLVALENRLEAAERRASKSTRAVSAIAQELRLPAQNVVDIADQLSADTCLTARQRQLLAAMKMSAKHQLSVLDDLVELVDVAGFDARRLQPLSAPVDIVRFLQETTDLARPEASRKGVRLDVAISGGTPAVVELDAPRLRQILLLLLTESIQATEKGHSLLSVLSIDNTLTTQAGAIALGFVIDDSGANVNNWRSIQTDRACGDLKEGSSSASTNHRSGWLAQSLLRAIGSELVVAGRHGTGFRFKFELKVKPVASADFLDALDPPGELRSSY